MPNSDEVDSTTIRQRYEFRADKEETARSIVRVFLHHLVQKFRKYKSEEFTICIEGASGLVQEDDVIIRYLIEQLRLSKFDIEFRGEKAHIDQLNIHYTNAIDEQADHFVYRIQDLMSTAALSGATGIPIIGILTMRVVAQIIVRSKTLYKAIVLDLDDTLWPGTLSEIGFDGIRDNLSGEQGIPFVAFMNFCRAIATELGVFIAISSRNDSGVVDDAISHLPESVFPLRDQIDYLMANSNNKSENIAAIANKLNILPDAIVFIDDNPIVRDEVRTALPGIFVPEWSYHNDLLSQLIAGCLFERNGISLSARHKRKQFKIIEKIIEDGNSRQTLPELHVRVFDDVGHIEATRLYSKSNQFKISANDDRFSENSESLYFEIYRVNGEPLGICSAITYTRSTSNIHVLNWAISCRYFLIGVEALVLLHMNKVANGGRLLINYQESEHNLKVKDVLKTYSHTFNRNEEQSVSIEFTNETISKLKANTNLKDISR